MRVQDLLLVDVGHTRTKFAQCIDDGTAPLPEMGATLAVHDEAPVPWADVQAWFPAGVSPQVFIAGTNSERVDRLVENWSPRLPAPFVLRDKSRIPITANVDFPEKVGVDRLLNGVAANALRHPGQPVITVSSGTAITVDVLNRQGVFEGGAILPGILLGAQVLHDYTTTLPMVDVWKLLENAPPLLGKNTQAAINSGLYWGHLGAVRELVNGYGHSLRLQEGDPLVLLTGGAAVILAPHLEKTHHHPMLTLQGLALTARALTAESESA